MRGSGDTRTPLLIGASTMWLSVLIAWIAVRWFGAGLGTVWFAFVLTTAPASVLMWWVYRRRIADFEQGRREIPDLSAAPPDIERTGDRRSWRSEAPKSVILRTAKNLVVRESAL